MNSVKGSALPILDLLPVHWAALLPALDETQAALPQGLLSVPGGTAGRAHALPRPQAGVPGAPLGLQAVVVKFAGLAFLSKARMHGLGLSFLPCNPNCHP